jgi:23S rRNA pseudouridine1911/1915/1917 synthase
MLSYAARPVPPEIRILHADPAVVVVDKPAGVLVVSAPNQRGPTMVDLVSAALGARVHAVHRLDRDTTGVLVMAKTSDSAQWLEDVFKQHAAERTYLALVDHVPSPRAGRIESRLREGADGVVRSVPGRGGELAITDYRVLGRVEHLQRARGRDGGATLIECKPRTGRRNQIRVHLQDLGCPICGDRKYGWRMRGEPSYGRVMLHAERIVLPRPYGQPDLEVAVDAPEPELHRGR